VCVYVCVCVCLCNVCVCVCVCQVASGRQADGRMIFECSAVMRHLTALGVPASRVFGDTFSWVSE
jgi:hypothetical protein